MRGADAIRSFSTNLITPYHPQPSASGSSGGSNSLLEELQCTVKEQRRRIQELEGQLAAAQRK